MSNRVFGNYEYVDVSFNVDKQLANKSAKRYRDDGRKTKVIKEGRYYVVYATTYNTKAKRQIR
jgi:hypothetical protein